MLSEHANWVINYIADNYTSNMDDIVIILDHVTFDLDTYKEDREQEIDATVSKLWGKNRELQRRSK